jgi:hypothetical protein
MVVLEIAFVLVNLAVPYWLWSKKATDNGPKVEREAVRKAVFRVIEASGGFPPCNPGDMADNIMDLCEKSSRKYTDKETTAFERAGVDVVFSCEVRKDEIKVRWVPEQSAEHDLDCGSDRDEQIAYAPVFTFNLKGQLRTIAYNTPGGSRGVTPVANCRRKLASAKAMNPLPDSQGEFLHALGRMPNDPSDYITKNNVCLIYDPAEAWEPYRKKFDK